jgi:hypothetical protein
MSLALRSRSEAECRRWKLISKVLEWVLRFGTVCIVSLPRRIAEAKKRKD